MTSERRGSLHAYLFILCLAVLTGLLLHSVALAINGASSGSLAEQGPAIGVRLALCLPLGWLAARSAHRMRK